MKRKLIVSGIAILSIFAAASLFLLPGGKAQAFIDPSDASLVARGRSVYASHCAACHGARLEGQPDWRTRLSNGRLPAPPHDASGHTWHHPDNVLVDITRNGLVPGKTAPEGYQSDMPAYAGLLSDEEITAVLAYIKSHWPPELLELQRKVTLEPGGG
ncbi:cytochrome c [Noviherbaspirillum sp. CPCC 100848]|uniref:Cytochrome c n=1 Tax=Noviherbaspirillum album TaxID=3080276 RepID=A0ABU6JDA7_9BURK|nr:cytochrome c [Noviherbaspirillum sp. CPCC 100848]MEC4721622.1 cytochrome c [Noviherbaspirillum sp. CPCC 100848]